MAHLFAQNQIVKSRCTNEVKQLEKIRRKNQETYP